MSGSPSAIPLLGYCDPLSARPGESVEFKVSSSLDTSCTARLKRIISGDPNPAGPGMIETACDELIAPLTFQAEHQPFYPGSCAISHQRLETDPANGLVFTATIYPTLGCGADQVIVSCGTFTLLLTAAGLTVQLDNRSATLATTLALHQWHHIEAGYDPSGSSLFVRQTGLADGNNEARINIDRNREPDFNPSIHDQVCIAANWNDGQHCDHFNGRIEQPKFSTGGTESTARILASWDFSSEISSDQVSDSGPDALHLQLVNSPTRAVTGSNWDGSEMCWRHKPDHYAAIHFHQDDIYDFGWNSSFTITLPDNMPSGIYAMEITSGEARDSIPFFVCPPRQQPRARLCVLIPTFTYTIYGNHARPDFQPEWLDRNREWNAYPHNPASHRDYGLSTYNDHIDGSGICHGSHLRPLFNLRPGYVTFGNSACSGLRHLPADTHLISWLHKLDIDYDIVTDRELHNEGVAAIAGYAAVATTSHPEYHTTQTLDALTHYTEQGGRLMYLGGNGFYWRIAIHPERPDLLEIRRAEDGIRAWAAEPGEYYNAFDGAYGGLWRRNGRPPQQLAGVGFSAQGSFFGSYYRRRCFDPQFDWLFRGIDSEILGDFGLSGGGAAGFELDRIDYRLGTPRQAVVLASSEGHDDGFMLVPEEQLTHLTNIPGEDEQSLLRADMIYYDLDGGGAVFSVGSITFCGSLPINDYDNNISTLLRNVVEKMTA